jgi:hypothetical protein
LKCNLLSFCLYHQTHNFSEPNNQQQNKKNKKNKTKQKISFVRCLENHVAASFVQSVNMVAMHPSITGFPKTVGRNPLDRIS